MNAPITKAIEKCYATKINTSKRRNIDFSMSKTTFANIKAQTHCAYSGLPFTTRDVMSFERINNDIGYVDGNVIPVIRELNHLKGNKTLQQLEKELSKIKQNRLKEYHYVAPDLKIIRKENAVNKPRLRGKKIKTYFNQIIALEQIIKKLQIQQDYYEKIIKDSALNGNDPSAPIKAFDNQMTIRVNSYKNHTKNIKNFLNKQKKKAAKYPTFDYSCKPVTRTVIKHDKKATSKETIHNMEMIVAAVKKFESLTLPQKYAVKLGLPTNTRKATLLKHFVVYNFINRV